MESILVAAINQNPNDANSLIQTALAKLPYAASTIVAVGIATQLKKIPLPQEALVKAMEEEQQKLRAKAQSQKNKEIENLKQIQAHIYKSKLSPQAKEAQYLVYKVQSEAAITRINQQLANDLFNGSAKRALNQALLANKAQYIEVRKAITSMTQNAISTQTTPEGAELVLQSALAQAKPSYLNVFLNGIYEGAVTALDTNQGLIPKANLDKIKQRVKSSYLETAVSNPTKLPSSYVVDDNFWRKNTSLAPTNTTESKTALEANTLPESNTPQEPKTTQQTNTLPKSTPTNTTQYSPTIILPNNTGSTGGGGGRCTLSKASCS
ncbi:MAG: hypothetical protein KDI39_10365 [Pseudomonadales bacterium]|nr:hypothetical protein [Pseudomonadales bacterium]